MANEGLRHIGIIMDGNGRWAKQRGLPRLMGHKEGIVALDRVLRAAKELGIPCLSVYAFSTENWNRPKAEVMGIMALLKRMLFTKIEELYREGIRLRFAGKLSDLSADIREIMDNAEKLTKDNTEMEFVICLNYGGQQEILDAVSRMIVDGVASPVTAERLREYLYLPDLPFPDLLIRTGGELRMSNFWLWEGAYSEYYFTDVYWPDFGKEDLEKAINDYLGRDRRYGTVK